MTKAELLVELTNNTYVILKPSPIEGIGVFAIKDITKGCRDMSKTEVDTLPAHAQFLIGNYCLYDDTNYFLPGDGFKKIDVSLFLNHSDTPNIISIDDGDYFEAIRDIQAGEELLVDYGEIVEGE